MRARLSMLVPVLLICLWWAISVRQAHDTSRAQTLLGQNHRFSHPAQTRSLLRHAGLLNPDAEVDILRARVAIKEGQTGQARQILQAVTRREPDNLEGWVWLAGAEYGDPVAGARALARIHALDPKN